MISYCTFHLGNVAQGDKVDSKGPEMDLWETPHTHTHTHTHPHAFNENCIENVVVVNV